MLRAFAQIGLSYLWIYAAFAVVALLLYLVPWLILPLFVIFVPVGAVGVTIAQVAAVNDEKRRACRARPARPAPGHLPE